MAPTETDVDLAAHSSSDEFVDGSIFRVQLHNFLTYNDAEFFPGPRLNLILGPNGTGKSSIVCALCVGLAGSTKLLGRADKVGQFVRHEKESGYTEIELYFESGNKVIRRNIFRDNRSTWMLNGRDTTLKKVLGVMEDAKIQIDNLCQFLPQDKVGEFSRMNPTQLLKATEAAITDGDLAAKHEELVEMQTNMRDKARDLEQVRAALEQKKTECRHLERDVERIVDHETRIKETELMEKKCLWLEFEEMKREVDELKQEKKRCREEMDKAKEERIVPMEDLVDKEVARLDELKSKKSTVDHDKREVDDKIKRQKQSIENVEVAQSKTASEIKELRNHHNQSRKRLEKLENDVEEWKRERAAMPDQDELKRQKAEIEKEQREREMEYAEISSKREVLVRELASIDEQTRRVTGKLNKLGDEDVQRKLVLQRFDPDSIRAAEWVKRNQHKLKRKVWGPLVLEMKVSDPLHAKYVEDTLPKWVMTLLITETHEDYKTILDGLATDTSSGRPARASVFVVEGGRCSAVNRPYNDEQMARYRSEFGITGFLDELVTAPDIIHEALRVHGGFHTVLVGTNRTEDLINQGGDIFSVISGAERRAALVTPFKKYVTSVSKYGNRNVTTRTNDLQNPRLLAASSSNEEEKAHMQQLLDDFATKSTSIKEEINALKAQEREFAEARNQSMHRVTEIRTQLKSMLRMDEKIAEAENKIYSLRSELARDLSEKEEALTRKLKNQAAKQARQLKDCLKLTQELLRLSARDASLSLQLSAQQVRVELTQKELKLAEATIKALQEAYKMSKESLMNMAKKAMKHKRKAEEEAPLGEYEERFDGLPEDLDELRGKIENNRSALDCFRGDISIRERFERISREIQAEESELVKLEEGVNSGESVISGMKETWHADLKKVVSQIDASFKEFFQDIGCVGEIVLDDEDSDISKWGIQRRAQFRKNTKLSTMTAEEQSGGEKSVGTIMYLMALQSLTKCPFRVVDEINQGMDVYNERKVFQRITKSSCGSKLPQYFLITPKLITGLSYHHDTKVMVILNGPYNGIKQEIWDANRFISSAKKAKRASGGDGAHLKKRIRA